MKRDMEHETEVDIDVDLDDGTVEIVRRTTETTTIEGLLEDDHVPLWSDDHGWSGFERRDDGWHRVNVSYEDGGEFSRPIEDVPGEDLEEHYIEDELVDDEDVLEAFKKHAEDPTAGGEGRFPIGCTPP